MLSAPQRHIFVYGTLLSGEQRDINRLKPAPRWLGRARVPGVLYDLGDYPGMRLGGRGLVLGEVYEISEELERVLDAVEEVWPQQSGEYTKREVALRLDGEVLDQPDDPVDELACLVYEIAPERVSDGSVIDSGDWVSLRKSRAGRIA